ncbi:MAG: hypothetical protein ACTJHU_01460 [Mycetocola sp.]
MLALIVVASTTGSHAPSDAETEAPPQGPGGALIEVPYLGSIASTPAASWSFDNCGEIREDFASAADGVNDEVLRITDCSADSLTIASDLYDAEQPELSLPITLTDGALSTRLHYRVRLAPPEPPSFSQKEISYNHPVSAGSRALIPLSELGLGCATCGDGVQLRVDEVAPAGASATASATHLIVTPGSNGAQTVAVTLAAADDSGLWSEPLSLTVRFVERGDQQILAAHVIRTAADGRTSVTLDDLVTSDSEWSVIGCGTAMHGLVVCGRDGTIDYIPDIDAPVSAGDRVIDQFSYHLATDAGEQDSGSITLVAPGGTLAQRTVAASTGAANSEGITRTLVVPADPPPATTQTGRFDAFVRVLDGDRTDQQRTGR